MQYTIVQVLDSWFTTRPEVTVIREFRHYLTAWVYKFLHYDLLADAPWKGTFTWKIEKK